MCSNASLLQKISLWLCHLAIVIRNRLWQCVAALFDQEGLVAAFSQVGICTLIETNFLLGKTPQESGDILH